MTFAPPTAGYTGPASRASLRALVGPAPAPLASETRRFAGLFAVTAVIALALATLYGLAGALGDDATRFANRWGPMVLLLATARQAYRTLILLPDGIWTGYFWVPASTAVFFGFGALVYPWGAEATVFARVSHPFFVTPVELIRANTLTAIGIGLLFAGFALAARLLGPPGFSTADLARARSPDARLLALVGLGAVAFGGALRYLLIKPAGWGMIDVVVPGAVVSAGFTADLGFAILAYVTQVRGGRGWWLVLLALLPPHLFLTLLSFSKTELLVALLFPLLGFYLGSRRLSALLLGFVALGVVYVLAQSVVAEGRAVIRDRTGTLALADYRERTEIVGRILAGETRLAFAGEAPGTQDWWTRLNLTEAQAKGMALYDAGIRADSLWTAWMRWVPRVIWPDKPILVGPGREFYALVSGNELAVQVGLSIYADMYWHAGWGGVVVMSPLVGVLFAWMSRLALYHVAMRNFLYFPVVLLMIMCLADGPTKYLVNGIIGPLPVIFTYILVVRAARGLVASGGGRLGFSRPVAPAPGKAEHRQGARHRIDEGRSETSAATRHREHQPLKQRDGHARRDRGSDGSEGEHEGDVEDEVERRRRGTAGERRPLVTGHVEDERGRSHERAQRLPRGKDREGRKCGDIGRLEGEAERGPPGEHDGGEPEQRECARPEHRGGETALRRDDRARAQLVGEMGGEDGVRDRLADQDQRRDLVGDRVERHLLGAPHEAEDNDVEALVERHDARGQREGQEARHPRAPRDARPPGAAQCEEAAPGEGPDEGEGDGRSAGVDRHRGRGRRARRRRKGEDAGDEEERAHDAVGHGGGERAARRVDDRGADREEARREDEAERRGGEALVPRKPRQEAARDGKAARRAEDEDSGRDQRQREGDDAEEAPAVAGAERPGRLAQDERGNA